MADEHVLICVAGLMRMALHLGHVAGCCCHRIFMHYERALGNRVLMVSGSDEHGTPITVTAETRVYSHKKSLTVIMRLILKPD